MCPLCLRKFADLGIENVVVDHDHVSGLVRGLLCRSCNRQEGYVVNTIRKVYGEPDEVKALTIALKQQEIHKNVYSYAAMASGVDHKVKGNPKVKKWLMRLGAYWLYHNKHPGKFIYRRG